MSKSRREFVGLSTAGIASLSLSGLFLNGCIKQNGLQMNQSIPTNPFLSWFNIDQAILQKVMSELTARGADHADLFFEHKRSNSIALEDGIISQANTSVDQGVVHCVRNGY